MYVFICVVSHYGESYNMRISEILVYFILLPALLFPHLMFATDFTPKQANFEKISVCRIYTMAVSKILEKETDNDKNPGSFLEISSDTWKYFGKDKKCQTVLNKIEDTKKDLEWTLEEALGSVKEKIDDGYTACFEPYNQIGSGDDHVQTFVVYLNEECVNGNTRTLSANCDTLPLKVEGIKHKNIDLLVGFGKFCFDSLQNINPSFPVNLGKRLSQQTVPPPSITPAFCIMAKGNTPNKIHLITIENDATLRLTAMLTPSSTQPPTQPPTYTFDLGRVKCFTDKQNKGKIAYVNNVITAFKEEAAPIFNDCRDLKVRQVTSTEVVAGTHNRAKVLQDQCKDGKKIRDFLTMLDPGNGSVKNFCKIKELDNCIIRAKEQISTLEKAEDELKNAAAGRGSGCAGVPAAPTGEKKGSTFLGGVASKLCEQVGDLIGKTVMSKLECALGEMMSLNKGGECKPPEEEKEEFKDPLADIKLPTGEKPKFTQYKPNNKRIPTVQPPRSNLRANNLRKNRQQFNKGSIERLRPSRDRRVKKMRPARFTKSRIGGRIWSKCKCEGSGKCSKRTCRELESQRCKVWNSSKCRSWGKKPKREV